MLVKTISVPQVKLSVAGMAICLTFCIDLAKCQWTEARPLPHLPEHQLLVRTVICRVTGVPAPLQTQPRVFLGVASGTSVGSRVLFELCLQEPRGGDLCVSCRLWVKVATVPTECHLDLSVHVQTAVSWQGGGIPFAVCVLRAFPGAGVALRGTKDLMAHAFGKHLVKQLHRSPPRKGSLVTLALTQEDEFSSPARLLGTLSSLMPVVLMPASPFVQGSSWAWTSACEW